MSHALNDTVLALIADLEVDKKGRVGLSAAKMEAWTARLAKPELRKQTRVFLDCVEAAMRLHAKRHDLAAAQLMLLSGLGLSDGKKAASRREGGDAWARMRPSRFSVVC